MSSLFYGQLPLGKRTREILLLGMVALCGLVPAHADSEFDEHDLLELYGDDETVSISTGTSKPVRLAPSVASVITEADILNRGASSLDEVLEMVPGLHVAVSGSNKLNAIYSIRGIHTSQNPQVLLLIDGLPIRQMFFAGRYTNYRLPAANIRRVEVIRGPGSAVYGADAFSGVINVITKSAGDLDGLRVGVRAGSFDSYEGWAQYGANFDSWDLAASLEYATANGDDDRVVATDFQTVFDGAFGTNASLAPGSLNTAYNVLNARLKLANENWNFSLSGWQNRDAGNGSGSAQALDPVGSTDAKAYQFSATYNGSFTEDWKYETRFFTSYYDEENDFVILPAGTTVLIGSGGNLLVGSGTPVLFTDGLRGTPSGEQKTNSAEFINHYRGFDKHNLRLAFGYQLLESDARESKNFGLDIIDGSEGVVDGSLTDVSDTDSVFSEDLDRKIKFISLQDEWALARDWELTVGIRYDDYSDFGSTVNPRLALVWATNYNLTSKLLYGRAFRAPSVGEKFQKNNPTFLGNPDIEPETIDTAEIAFDYRPNASTTTKLNLFAYAVSDLIDFVTVDDPKFRGMFQAQNAIDQTGYGFEVEYEVEVSSNLNLYGNYSWQRSERSEDKDSDQRVAEAPGQQTYVGVNWRFMQDWHLSSQLSWVADRKRARNDSRSEIDDYFSVDMTLRKQFKANNLEASFVVYNLFDEAIHEPSTFTAVLNSNSIEDFPMEGRRLSLELRYKFSN